MDAVEAIAKRLGATAAQVALAWLTGRGDDIVPIPGTKRVRYLEENVASLDIMLDPEDVAALEAVFLLKIVLGMLIEILSGNAIVARRRFAGESEVALEYLVGSGRS